MDSCSVFSCMLRVCCLVVTLVMTGVWISKYCLDEDLCLVDYKEYFTDRHDVYPVVSMCFKNAFQDETWLKLTYNMSVIGLLSFFKGNGFNPQTLNIPYENITIDLNDYISTHWIERRNGSSKTYPVLNVKDASITPSYSGFWKENFYKCFVIEVVNKDVQTYSILINNKIFHQRIRPTYYDFFTLIHYPNQLLRSLPTMKYSWKSRKTQDDYEMRFAVHGTETLKRRHKGPEGCNQNWKFYDDDVMDQHLKSLGCRAPYQSLITNYAQCSSNEKIQQAKFSLASSNINKFPPPCRSIVKIFYAYDEIELAGTVWNGTGNFWVTMFLMNTQFKVIFILKQCILLKFVAI